MICSLSSPSVWACGTVVVSVVRLALEDDAWPSCYPPVLSLDDPRLRDRLAIPPPFSAGRWRMLLTEVQRGLEGGKQQPTSTWLHLGDKDALLPLATVPLSSRERRALAGLSPTCGIPGSHGNGPLTPPRDPRRPDQWTGVRARTAGPTMTSQASAERAAAPDARVRHWRSRRLSRSGGACVGVRRRAVLGPLEWRTCLSRRLSSPAASRVRLPLPSSLLNPGVLIRALRCCPCRAWKTYRGSEWRRE